MSEVSHDTPHLEQLLLQVLDAPDAQQGQALDAACRAAPELAPRLRQRLQDLSRFGLVRGEAPTPTALPDWIGPYRVLQILGSGGMGVVYLAEHEQLRRRVALKCIRPEFLHSQRARDRFARETQAIARLSHPGLCTLYETGDCQGQPFLAMQFVVGEPLEVQLRRARAQGQSAWSRLLSGEAKDGSSSNATGSDSTARSRAVHEATGLVQALAEAVHVMHEAGVVHRDLKPANIMVAEDSRPVLLDFGLVRDLLDDAPALTLSSDVVGTPAYMAPEQVEPRGRPIDRRTDVHALGAILYECLTLRPPLVGSGREDTYRRILTEEPVELRRLQPAASRDLASVVHRALAKEPRQRFPTAAAFAQELQRVLDGQPTQTRPPGALRRVALWARQRPAVTATLVTLFVALTVGLSVSLSLLRQAQIAVRIHEAVTAAARDPAVGAIKAAEALKLGGGEPARSALFAALADLRLVQSWQVPIACSCVAATAKPELIVAGLWDGRLLVLRDGKRTSMMGQQGRPLAIHIDEKLGRVLVIGSREHATLLDLRGNEVASLALHPEEVFTPAARLSHHERRCYGAIAGGIQSDTVYTIAGTGRLRQFDAAGARQQERVLERIDGIDWCGADRDPSAEFVALGNLAGTLALFRADGTLEWQKRLHDGPLRYVRFSPDRRFVLASTGIVPDWSVLDRYVPCSDHAATVVDLRGETRWTLARHQANITSATWSPSGTHVATSSFDREVRVWHLPTTPTAEPFGVTILPHATAVLGSGFFLEDRQVLSGAFKGNAAVWSTFRRERTASLQSHGSGIASWTVVAGSDQVLTTSYDRRLQLFDSRSRWREEWETDAPLAHALWDPLGDSVWTMDRTGLTRRWRPGRRESDLSFDLGPRLVDRELVLHGTWWTGRECLVIRTTSNRVLTVDLRSGDVFELASARGTKSQPGHSAFLCASGDTVVWGGGSSSTIQVWRNQQTRDLKLPEYQGVMDAWLAPDGSWAAFGMGEDAGRLVFEDLAKGEATRVVSTPGQVQGVAAAPDGTVHVVGRDGWLGRLSRTDDMEQVATFDGFGNRIAVSPDGHLIAVGTSTGLRVFTAGGEHRLTLPSSDIPWRGVSFSHDGRRLLVTTGTGQIQVWPLPLDLSGADLLATSPYSWALEGARRQIAVSAIAPTVADYERLVREGELQRARDLGNRLMSDALELADAIPLYEIAWAIVQNGAPEPRDLELGLRAAIASCELTSHREAHTLNALARVHFWQQDLPRAIEVQEQAVAAAHENPDTRNPQELVDVLEDYRVIQALDQYRTMLGTSRRAEAGDLGERLVDEAISAGKARHLNRIAWAIVDPAAPIERADRDLDLALRAATKAVELTDRDRGDMLDTLARVYFWLGDHRQALELQDDAVAVVLRNPSTGNLDNLRRTQQEYRRLVGR